MPAQSMGEASPGQTVDPADILGRLVTGGGQCAVFGSDAGGRIRCWTAGAAQRYGTAAPAGVAALHGDEAWRDALAGAARSGAWHGPLAGRRDDGTAFSADTLILARPEGGQFLWIVGGPPAAPSDRPLRDAAGAMMERKHAEELFRNLLETAPDPMVIVDQKGEIVLVNSQTEKLLGYRREELLGQSVELLVPTSARARHPAHRTHYFANPTARPMGIGMELRARRKDGFEFPIEISLSPLHTEEGVLVSSALRDITERKRFEQALQDKNLELEKASQAKDRFLASMSHELRTPLNAIIGFTGTLLMRLPGPLTPDQDKQLSTIQSSARHLLSLINDLLDLAKIESGKVEIRLAPTSVQQVVEEVAAALRPLAADKGLRFSVDMPGEEVVVRTDRRALSQILINLASNAIKYTEQGRVGILLHRHLEAGQGQVDIVISDTGVGIRSADQARLFQAFSQLDSASTRRYEGTGLGLHLSQKLADLIGARIAFTSEFGRGSVFTLSVPEG